MAAIAAIVMMLGAGYLLCMFQRVAFGDLSDFLKGLGDHLHDMDPIEIATLAPLAVLVVVFGLFPAPILNLIQGPVSGVLDHVGHGCGARGFLP